MPPRPPLAGSQLLLATIALSMANFMEVLDVTIANVSIPSISGDLGVSPNQGTWVITSYAVANAISVLSTGWLSQRFGQVKVFTVAILLFTMASLGCGLSGTFGLLLFFRVLQGGVSGLMVPLSQALLLSCYPPERRGVGMAVWGMTVTVAPVLGPIFGGLITDSIGWSWIFYINIPFGIAAAFLTWRLLADRETETRRVPLDLVGFLLIVVWVGCLQVILDKGNDLDWFGSPFIVTLAVLAGLCFTIFMIWECSVPNPIINLRLFLIRNFTTASIAMALGYTVFFATVIVLPLWLQTQLGYTATWAGLVVAPTGLLAIVLAPVIGRNIARVDPRKLATLAFLVFGVLSFWRSTYPSDPSYLTLAGPQFVQGIAVALFFTPLISLALGSLAPQDVAAGSGLMNFLRMTAASFGASVAITVWDHRNAFHQTALVAHTAQSDPAYLAYQSQAGLAGLPEDGVPGLVAQQLLHQSTVRAVDDLFWGSGWLFLAVIAFVWLARRPAGAAPVAAH